MPNRLALLGAKKGPYIDISRLASPQLKITGLPVGATVTVQTIDGVRSFNENGVFPVDPCAWAILECDRPARSLVCMFIPSKAA